VVLNSIWGASASNIYAGGSLCGQAMTMKYDGTSWTQDLQECGGVFSRSVVSIWGTSASSVFYIVRNSPAPRSPGASLYVFDGQGTWSPNYNHFCSPPPGCDPYLNAGWSGAPDFVSAVGDSGFVVHYDGAAWTEQARGTTRNLNAVWGSGTGGAAAIFAVGDTGTIVSFDGSAWHPVASGTTQPLYGIWGTSASDVFAVGGGGTILHYDGTTWTAQSSGSTQTLRGVWGTSGTSVFVVGDAGTVLRYDGTSWVALAATTSIDLRGVWGSSATNVFAVGHPR
jgi:hypothetical protein